MLPHSRGGWWGFICNQDATQPEVSDRFARLISEGRCLVGLTAGVSQLLIGCSPTSR